MSARRVQLVYQAEEKDCGPACLSMVARFYGKPHSLQMIKELCPVTRKGVSLIALQGAVKQIGLKVMTIKCTVDDLDEIPLPAIILWNRHHFAVLYRINTKAALFYVADPAAGRIRYSKAGFQSGWQGAAGTGVIIVIAGGQGGPPT